MHDDELMDELLTKVMAADVPELSAAFDARIMRRVRPRRLTAKGRVVMVAYVVVAAVAAVWLMSDARIEWIAAAAIIGVPVAAGAGAYGRRLAQSTR